MTFLIHFFYANELLIIKAAGFRDFEDRIVIEREDLLTVFATKRNVI